jgi:hypothetical protein
LSIIYIEWKHWINQKTHHRHQNQNQSLKNLDEEDDDDENHTHLFTPNKKPKNNLNVNHGYLGSFYDEERNNIRKGMKSMFIVRHQL